MLGVQSKLMPYRMYFLCQRLLVVSKKKKKKKVKDHSKEQYLGFGQFLWSGSDRRSSCEENKLSTENWQKQ